MSRKSRVSQLTIGPSDVGYCLGYGPWKDKRICDMQVKYWSKQWFHHRYQELVKQLHPQPLDDSDVEYARAELTLVQEEAKVDVSALMTEYCEPKEVKDTSHAQREESRKRKLFEFVVESDRKAKRQRTDVVQARVVQDLERRIQTETNRTLGQRLEQKGLKQYEAEYGIKVSDPQRKRMRIGSVTYEDWIHPHGSCTQYDIVLNGITDASHGDVIVEQKVRRNGFSPRGPYEHEKIQVQCYIQMFDKREGHIHETFGKQTRTTIVPRDDVRWRDKIVPNILRFAQSVCDLDKDSENMREYLFPDVSVQKVACALKLLCAVCGHGLRQNRIQLMCRDCERVVSLDDVSAGVDDDEVIRIDC